MWSESLEVHFLLFVLGLFVVILLFFLLFFLFCLFVGIIFLSEFAAVKDAS